MSQATSLTIGGVSINPGESKSIDLPFAKLYDHTEMYISVKVIRGKKAGPVLFVSAAVHGDELNGVDIIKRLLRQPRLKRIQGTLIVVPIVNIYGFNNLSRYLPDRRDLNRSFPGSKAGSLTARLAHVFMQQIVKQCTHGIDLHTGAIHRENLPHIRACIDQPETKKLAHAFGVPVILNSTLRDGSLRQEVYEKGIPMLLFEGGEALRFNENVIRSGLKGILSVMEALEMIPAKPKKKTVKKKTFEAIDSYWVRAAQSGLFTLFKKIGEEVHPGDILGVISDPFGEHEMNVTAETGGIIIGQLNLPLVNRGDALLHVALFKDSKKVAQRVERYDAGLEMDAQSARVSADSSFQD